MKDGAEREGFLVLRAQTGDREALDALLASVHEPLYRYLLGLFALGAHVGRGVGRVLKAVEMLDR